MRTAAVDDIITTLGWWGPYQKMQFAGLLLALFSTSFHIMSIVFIGREVEHKCAPVQNDFYNNFLPSAKVNLSARYRIVVGSTNNSTTISYNECSIDVKDELGKVIWSGDCPNGYLYSEVKDRSIVSEWDLVCDKNALSDLSQTVFAVGMATGAALLPAMADRFGRKPLYMAAHVLLVSAVVTTAFAKDFLTFMVLRFFTGAAQQGVQVIAWIMIIELLPTKHRALAGQVGLIVWPVGLLNLGLIGWLTRSQSWRTMQLVSAGLSSYIVVQWWLSDETLRWLVANNKRKAVEQIIRRAARKNQTSVARVMDVFNSVMLTETEVVPLSDIATQEEDGGNDVDDHYVAPVQTKTTHRKGVEQFGLFTAMRNVKVMKVTAISAYNWFAGSAIYYGLIMTSGSLVDDLHLGYTINILVEIPAGIVFLLLINRMSRRVNVVLYHSITGVSLLLAVILTTTPSVVSLPGANFAAIVFSLLGKFAIAAGYGAMWVYTPEYFPTNIRNTCFGIASLAARVGAMVAPFARTLGHHVPWLPGLIFSSMCFLILGVTWLLPETFNRELPQTVSDMEELMTQQGPRTKHGESRR